MKRSHRKVVVLLIYMIFLTIVSLVPGNGGTHLFPGADKIVHFLLYAGFGFVSMAASASINEGVRNYYQLVKITALCSMYGLFMEACQTFVPFRSAEFLDAVANFLGSFAGVAFFYMGFRRGKGWGR